MIVVSSEMILTVVAPMRAGITSVVFMARLETVSHPQAKAVAYPTIFFTMRIMNRPRGLDLTALLMIVCNAMGWAIVDWSKPHAVATFIVFTILIVIGYVSI